MIVLRLVRLLRIQKLGASGVVSWCDAAWQQIRLLLVAWAVVGRARKRPCAMLKMLKPPKKQMALMARHTYDTHTAARAATSP